MQGWPVINRSGQLWKRQKCPISPQFGQSCESVSRRRAFSDWVRAVRFIGNIISGFQPSDRHKDAVEQGVRIGRAAGNINVNRDDRVHAPASGVVSAKDSTAAPARADGDAEARIGGGLVGL